MVKNPLYKFKETRYNKKNIGQEGCPMARMGFIQDKLEIKFLLLYIASRLIEPVPFEAMQELAMIDDGVDFFDFSECMNDLVTS